MRHVKVVMINELMHDRQSVEKVGMLTKYHIGLVQIIWTKLTNNAPIIFELLSKLDYKRYVQQYIILTVYNTNSKSCSHTSTRSFVNF